jgi:hypothetical protein
VKHCSSIGDNTARLACYDALATHTDIVTSPAPTPVERFGRSESELLRAEAAHIPAVPALREMQAFVTESHQRGDGLWLLVLDNGQAWRQVTSSERIDAPVGSRVIIRSAHLGSYLMLDARGNSVRVHRVR